MPRTRRRGLAQAGELPGTVKRSSKEAQETFTKAHDSAVQAYGEGDQADRAAYTEFKQKFEKRGDHWIPKQPASPEDLTHAAALRVAQCIERTGMTKVPSVYETEGTSPGPPGPGIRANRRFPAASRVPE